MTFPYTRLRRLRNTKSVRALVQDITITSNDLIYPIIIQDKLGVSEINGFPDVYRYDIDSMLKQVAKAAELGIKAVALFPSIAMEFKSLYAEEVYNDNGLVQRAIRACKKEFPDMMVISDVALDPYTLHGQDGIVDETGYVLNDPTVATLVKQAVSHIQAGADCVGPSDMMDGRIQAIRSSFEDKGFYNSKIISYCAKFNSNLYGPYREAVGSKSLIKGDKLCYYIDPQDSKAPIREIYEDVSEAADILLIKPAGAYLDIIARASSEVIIPIFAYQVSGEYAMLKLAAANNIMAFDKALHEHLIAIKRAGASAIFSYGALEIAQYVKNLG